MMDKLREKILNVKAKEEVINVPEWGVDVKIKELTAKDKYDISSKTTNMKTGVVDISRMAAEFIIACTYDPETGERLFEKTDVEAIGNMPSSGIDKVFEEITRINKLEDIDETVKN
jgi:hypothetical protein